MVDVIVTPAPSTTMVIVQPVIVESEIIVTPPGSGGGSGSTFQNLFIQTTDPGPGLVPGFSYIWFVTDGTGSVVDIRKGVA